MTKARKAYWVITLALSAACIITMYKVAADLKTKMNALTETSAYATPPLPAQASVPAAAPLPAPPPPVPSPLKPETSAKPAEPEFITCDTGQRVPFVGPYGSTVTPCGGASYGRDPGMVAMHGWNDQPSRDKPGRVHENLRVQFVPASGRHPARAPCMQSVRLPASTLVLPYGKVTQSAHIGLRPCIP